MDEMGSQRRGSGLDMHGCPPAIRPCSSMFHCHLMERMSHFESAVSCHFWGVRLDVAAHPRVAPILATTVIYGDLLALLAKVQWQSQPPPKSSGI